MRRLRRLVLGVAVAAFLGAPLAVAAGGPPEKGPRPLTISHGERVNLADYLVPGKTTVFDFYSEYCPTCRSIAPDMAKLHASRDDIAVVMVDINRPGVNGIDWKSPVAKQYDLPSTPQLKVYGPDGKMRAEGSAAYKLVTGWFN